MKPLYPILLALAACGPPADPTWAEVGPAVEQAERGELAPLVALANRPDVSVALVATEQLARLGDRPEVPRALEKVYRLHPDPVVAGAALDGLAPLRGDPPEVPCAQVACEAGRPDARVLVRQSVPRLLFSESCISLGLHLGENPHQVDPTGQIQGRPMGLTTDEAHRLHTLTADPRCWTADDLEMGAEDLVYLLALREAGTLVSPVTGASFRFRDTPRRHRSGATDVWSFKHQAWLRCCDADGQAVVVPGLAPR